ncbi:MAG: tetraacyldisaccharide 4'-kinase [Bacteroidia bacterium]|nr:tetraacyldisaccharide 4'-kinase [Bacteroidia bacterium]
MNLARIILSPFSVTYQSILRLRNYLYDTGILGVTSFDIPTISVGNLAFGGTGKTPHIEYLIRLLVSDYKVAVLSRGYKRKTTGYVFADFNATVEMIGDEPWQLSNKFKSVAVGVCENRVLGLPDLLFDAPETQLVLLDDAFQHRAIKPGLSILLTDYNRRFTHDNLAPAGTLREYAAAYKRADIIVVTKCEPNMRVDKKMAIIGEIKPLNFQKVYFSYLRFGELQGIYNPITLTNVDSVLVFAGIANPLSLLKEVNSRYKQVIFKQYPDHYSYNRKDADEIIELYNQLTGAVKIIITTEKDMTKLLNAEVKAVLEKLPLLFLPVEVEFFGTDKVEFDKQVLNYVGDNSTYN